MRKPGSIGWRVAVGLTLLLSFWGVPVKGVAATPNMHLAASIHFRNASDLAFRGNLAFAGSFDERGDGGMYVIDISEPSQPRVLSHFPCWGYQDDVAVYGDYVILGMHDSGGHPGCSPVHRGGVRIVDVSNPAHPVQVAFLELPEVDWLTPTRLGPIVGVYSGGGTHTLTVVEETGYVYSSPGGDSSRLTQPVSSQGPLPVTIVDVHDPLHPRVAGRFIPPDSSGCHDISVRGSRAYCAGSERTQIWDITDPVHPIVTANFRNPLMKFSHSAVPSSDGKTLVLGDEETFFQVCLPDGSSPVGAFWFYDISDERHPELRGHLGPVGLRRIQSAGDVWCTAHNFNMVPGRPWMVAASYAAGTSVIDFSDVDHPRAIGYIRPPSADSWSSYYHDGAIYVTDKRRGFDVITMDGLSG